MSDSKDNVGSELTARCIYYRTRYCEKLGTMGASCGEGGVISSNEEYLGCCTMAEESLRTAGREKFLDFLKNFFPEFGKYYA